jgi:predicted Zn-dependent peptidase
LAALASWFPPRYVRRHMRTSTTLHTLENGVRVVHDPMPGLETIALSVVAGRGAAYEDPARSGWSHLLEHMVFKGAGSRSSRDIVEVIEAQGGQINAATGYERTSFQVRALKGGLDLGMGVLADLVLRPTLDEGDLTREKQVVAQEIAEAADAPDDYVFDLVQAAAWGDHPLARPILGTVDTVNSATVEGLSHWRGQIYAADRLIVSASGAVALDEVLDLARRAFGAMPAAQRGPGLRPGRLRRRPQEPGPQAGAGASGVHAAGRQRPRGRLFRLADLRRGPGRGDVVAAVPGGAREARAGLQHRRLCRHLCRRRGPGGLCRLRGRRRGRDRQGLRRADPGLADRIDDAELARAKAQLKAHMFMAREQPLSRAEQAAGQALMFDRLYTPAELAQAVDMVTVDDLRRLGRTILGPAKAASAVLGAKAALKAGEVFEKTLA